MSTKTYLPPDSEFIEFTAERTILSGEGKTPDPWGGENAGDEEQPGF